MSTIRRLAPWLIALFGAGVVPAGAQNIDAGKSPAQIFGDTCAGCHKNARELRRASASFLRSHYMTGAEEAGAMSSYLASLPADPRAALQKRTPGTTGTTTTPSAEAAKPPPRPTPADQAKAAPAQPASKAGRRVLPGSVETRPAAVATPDETPADAALAPATPVTSSLAMPVNDPPMPLASAPVAAAAPKPLASAPVAAAAPTKPVLVPFEE